MKNGQAKNKTIIEEKERKKKGGKRNCHCERGQIRE